VRSLHIGVVSTDLGTKGTRDALPAPPIGVVGQGGCDGVGNDGWLQPSPLLWGGERYIADFPDSTSDTRAVNYDGTLAEAFNSISSLGSGGCGFEQPLQAARRVFDRDTNGFHWADRALAIIVVSDEDDCSIAHSTLLDADTSILGPLQSFRCTRFGVTCDDGGATPDEMNQVGPKTGCHANDSGQYLESVAALADDLKAVVSNPNHILFGAIAAPSSSLQVEMSPPPGGGTAVPSLAPACVWSSPDQWMAPSARLLDAAHQFRRNSVQQACTNDLSGPAIQIARDIRTMMGDYCLYRPVPEASRCEATDTRGDGLETTFGACNAYDDAPCFRFVDDPGCALGKRFEVVRDVAPSADTVISLRCPL
jgi:hypothetical protein